MVARLRGSFRSGNLAENLGSLLLKGIAAVADVPRPEDVGFDAVASLLRRDSDGNLYAEDSFFVQLKAFSQETLTYQGFRLTWLLQQSLPMFIGRVSLKDSRIALYPTVYVNHAVLALHAEQVTVRFGPSSMPPFLQGQEWSPWAGEGDHSATVWLGPPLLEWSLGHMTDRPWLAEAYELMKRFLAIARREYELLSFGQGSVLLWATNDKDSIRSSSAFAKSHPDNFEALAERCKPGLEALRDLAFAMPEDRGTPMLSSLVHLVASMRALGADIDPSNFFAKMLVSVLDGRQTREPGKS
jgi:hypothetical protein